MFRQAPLLFLAFLWGMISSHQIAAALPQIFSSNLASENYVEDPEINANIIIAHSSPIVNVSVNGIDQTLPQENTVVLEKSIILESGENRIRIEAKDQQGETSVKDFFLYYGSREELAHWKQKNEEKLIKQLKQIEYAVDLRLQYDDNALFTPLNESTFRLSQKGTQKQDNKKKTYELLTDFNASYAPATSWKWGDTPVTPGLSYRFQSQWNSTLKESGYLSHWLSGHLTWKLGNHQLQTKYSTIFLRTNLADSSWEDSANLQVVELSGLLFHSARLQSHPFLIFIDQNFNDDLEEDTEGSKNSQIEQETSQNDKGHDLDGVKRLLGYGWTYHIVPSSRYINAILLQTTSDTRKDYEDYSSLGSIVKYDHHWKFYRISAAGHYEKQIYHATRPDFNGGGSEKKRLDDFFRFSFGVQRSINENAQLSAHLIRSVNYSKVSAYDYQRNTADVGITVQF
ncbi:MAG: hypothetical protein HQM14_08145 [SAR324 cluster bacterium]|nr:hypothetical protein [SAR324 cluster bacterium]